MKGDVIIFKKILKHVLSKTNLPLSRIVRVFSSSYVDFLVSTVVHHELMLCFIEFPTSNCPY